MRSFVLIMVVALFTWSCKKNNGNPTTSNSPALPTNYTVKDYFPMHYGNYWVYEYTVRDTNNTVLFNGIDSCYITDSTFLRGKYFYQIWGTNPLYAGGQLYTDSAGHIIHSSLGRTISLTHNDSLFDAYTNYGNGEWSHLYTVMKTFPTSTYSHNNKTYIDCISKYEYCYNNIDTACTNNKVMFNIYAPNVGVVYSRYYYLTTCNIFEEKLLRYKVY